MSLFGKLVICFIVAAIAAAIFTVIDLQATYINLFAAFAVATIATSLLGSIKANPAGAAAVAITAPASAPKRAQTKSPKPQKSANVKRAK